MYIVISEKNCNTEIKKIRNVDDALMHMEDKIAKGYDCTLSQVIDTDIETKVKVRIAGHEELL